MKRLTLVLLLLASLCVLSLAKHHKNKGLHGEERRRSGCFFVGNDGTFYKLWKLNKRGALRFSDEASGADVSLSLCRPLADLGSSACDASTAVCIGINGSYVSAGRLPNVTLSDLPTTTASAPVPLDPVEPTQAPVPLRPAGLPATPLSPAAESPMPLRPPPKPLRPVVDVPLPVHPAKAARGVRAGEDGEDARNNGNQRQDDDDDHKEDHDDDKEKDDDDDDAKKKAGKDRNKHESDDDDEAKRTYGFEVLISDGDVCADDEQQRMSTVIDVTCAKHRFKVRSASFDGCKLRVSAESRVACPRGDKHHARRHRGHDDDDDSLMLPLLVGGSALLLASIFTLAVIIAYRRRRQSRAAYAALNTESSKPAPSAPVATDNYAAAAYDAALPMQPVSTFYPDLNQQRSYAAAQSVMFAPIPGGQFTGQQPATFVYPAFFAPQPQRGVPAVVSNDNSLL